MCEQDTRKRLERCLRVFLGLCIDEEPDPTTSGIYYNILGLLDRQEAITKREEILSYEYTAERQSDRIFELHNKLADAQEDIVELKAERDELQEAIDAMGNGQFYAMYLKACEERDHFKDLVRKQSESNH